VPEPIELPGVIVESHRRRAERRDAERDCERRQQRERKKPVASHRDG
jgi:hypothetical protein